MDIQKFWDAVLRQKEQELAGYFAEDAYINWHNTNEQFTAAEFIRANCEYPGQWAGEIERICHVEDQIITATRVHTKDGTQSFHAVSFFQLRDGKIASIDEYWGDDTVPPQWRQNKHIGRKIRI